LSNTNVLQIGALKCLPWKWV